MDFVVMNKETGQLYVMFLFKGAWVGSFYYKSTKISFDNKKKFNRIFKDKMEVLGFL